MAIYMGAGPSVMYASHALDAFTQFETAAKPATLARGLGRGMSCARLVKA